MTVSDANLIAALMTARAALDSALVALSTTAEVAAPEAAPPAPTTCQHEHRTDHRTFGVIDHWVCDDCGYEYRR